RQRRTRHRRSLATDALVLEQRPQVPAGHVPPQRRHDGRLQAEATQSDRGVGHATRGQQQLVRPALLAWPRHAVQSSKSEIEIHCPSARDVVHQATPNRARSDACSARYASKMRCARGREATSGCCASASTACAVELSAAARIVKRSTCLIVCISDSAAGGTSPTPTGAAPWPSTTHGTSTIA